MGVDNGRFSPNNSRGLRNGNARQIRQTLLPDAGSIMMERRRKTVFIHRNINQVLFSRFWRHRPVTPSHAEYENIGGNIKGIDYVKLEERRVLNASFAFDLMTAELTLDNFTDDTFAADRVNVSRDGDLFLFTLEDGVWSGIDGGTVRGSGTSVLAADSDALEAVNIFGTTDDAYAVNFEQFSFAGDFDIFTLNGAASFQSVTQDEGTALQIDSRLSIRGVELVELTNSGNDFGLVSVTAADSVSLTDSDEIALADFETSSALSVSAERIQLTESIQSQTVFFQATIGLEQFAAAEVRAENLLLSGHGAFDFSGLENQIQSLAADIDGDLSLDNSGSLQFENLSFDSITFDGLNVDGDFDLSTRSGDVFQSAKLVVSGHTSIDAGAGHVCLSGPESSVDPTPGNDLFRLSVNADSAYVTDRNDLIIGNSHVADQLWLVAGDYHFDPGQAGGKIVLDGELYVGESVVIQASRGVEQISGGVQSHDLLLGGDETNLRSGEFNLAGSNRISRLSANVGGGLHLSNGRDLQISNLHSASACSMSTAELAINGLTTDSDIRLHVDGNLFIDATVMASTGTILFDVGDSLTQSAHGTLLAQSFGMKVGGITELAADNRFETFAVANLGTTNLKINSDAWIGVVRSDSLRIDGVLVESDFSLELDGSLRQLAPIVIQGGSSLVASGEICLCGADGDADGHNDNDFAGAVDVFSYSSVEIVDSNSLLIDSAVANEQIRLRSGDGGQGELILRGAIQTLAGGGVVLLQSDSGAFQHVEQSVITADNLLLGSEADADGRKGTFDLAGDNRIQNVAAFLDHDLHITNAGDLQIAPLQFFSNCHGSLVSLSGVDSEFLSVNVKGGDLTDAYNSMTAIRSSATLLVDGSILLGDGEATLKFSSHSILDLVAGGIAEDRLTIGSPENAAENVSLFVNSSVILGDVFVANQLFVDTVEPGTSGQAGDILQTRSSETGDSLIRADSAAFISNASIQLTNTDIARLALEASRNTGHLIDSFVENQNIGNTFTGSLDAGVFADDVAATYLRYGNTSLPVDGVFNVTAPFRDAGFVEGNNEFVNEFRVGAVVVNSGQLELSSFRTLGLNSLQLENVTDPGRGATVLGDLYIETREGFDLQVSADAVVTSSLSNLTVVAGGILDLKEDAEFRRMESEETIGIVNRLRTGLSSDGFVFQDPQSVFDAPGDFAFSDLNAQLDSGFGFQDFRFYFGGPGERSFNLIVGWFIDFVTPGQAINSSFQNSLLQPVDQETEGFSAARF